MGNLNSVQREFLEKKLSTMKNRGAERTDDSLNSKLVQCKFIDAFNLGDAKTMQRFCAPGAMFCFFGAEQGMPLAMFMQAVDEAHHSLPDICITYDDIREVRPGFVEVTNVRTRGTHTGTPFAFANLPPLPASGKLVEDFAPRYTLRIENGKVSAFMIEMEGTNVVGPAGYYMQLGGSMQLVA